MACACFAEPLPRSTVVYAQEEAAISGYEENPAVVRKMVEALVVSVTGKPDATEAWCSLVKPTDRVGIKVSASGGPLFSTHKTIVETIADGLASAGVPRANIIVWDRADMSAAGFSSK